MLGMIVLTAITVINVVIDKISLLNTEIEISKIPKIRMSALIYLSLFLL